MLKIQVKLSSLNVLVYHARNIQTAQMLAPYELHALQCPRSPDVMVDDAQLEANAEPDSPEVVVDGARLDANGPPA